MVIVVQITYRPCPLLKKPYFQSWILQTVCRPQGSHSRHTVQAGVHPRLRDDYDQSSVPTPESWEIGFYFVAMDTTLLYIIIGMY